MERPNEVCEPTGKRAQAIEMAQGNRTKMMNLYQRDSNKSDHSGSARRRNFFDASL